MAPSAAVSGYHGMNNRVGGEMGWVGAALGEFTQSNDRYGVHCAGSAFGRLQRNTPQRGFRAV
jgi:hypothetical protein